MNRKIFNSIFCWIINIMLWISCGESSPMENLRSNHDEKGCMSELVSRKLLSDDQFTASSYYQNKKIFQPSMARLPDIHSQSSSNDGSAWCPETEVHRDFSEWIEVDFRQMTLLRALYTVGQGEGNFQRFSPEIVIKYQRTQSSNWHTYHDMQNNTIISINTDSRTELRTSLRTIVARKIRIYPLATRSGPKMVCLKIAFLGCYLKDEVISYTAPQGDWEQTEYYIIDLRDKIYDGTKSNLLWNGLGLLMDNYYQKHLVTLQNDNKTVFIGWKCTEARSKSPISLTFYFDQERIFDEVSIYYITNTMLNIMLTSPIIVSVGYNNDTHRSTFNKTVNGLLSGYFITIPLERMKGTMCTVNISCKGNSWIVLSEVQIKSTKSREFVNQAIIGDNKHIATVKDEIKPLTDYNDDKTLLTKKYVSFMLAIGLAVILVLVLLSCVAFLYFKMKRLKQYKVSKKLEFTGECSNAVFWDPSARTVFTIPSKRPSISSMSKTLYYQESKPPISNMFTGSQPSDGIYASWPNTDEDADVPSVDKDEDKSLLVADDSKTMSKDYAVYQPGIIITGSEYLHPVRSSYTIPNGMSVAEKVPLSASNLKIVQSFDLPKSTPMVTYRNCQNLVSYQHLINYRGLCGDVDFRCPSLPIRLEPHTQLDSGVKIVSKASLVFVQPWLRGAYGSVDLVTASLTNNETGRYFMKKLHPDCPPSVKSKFILDMKILSILNISSIAKLVAIVVDCDLIPNDIDVVIRSTKFSLLVENIDGYNLKAFLRNINYPCQAQKYKTTTLTLPSQCPMSVSSILLLISQISSGLKQLEDLDLTHRDVGCRNCTIDSRSQIKLYPGGYVTTQPLEDYCCVELQSQIINFPLRWMAPESIYKGLYTSKSDVWSFGVTMWEIFTMCRIMPYPSLANEALMELLTDRENAPRLPCPQNCPREMYELMLQCWSWDESLRPSFVDINLLLQIKTTGVTNTCQLMLPAPPFLMTTDNHLSV